MATDTQTKKIDTAESPEDSQVRGWYKKLMAGIYDIDEMLDAQADAASGGKRKFTNELVEATKPNWEAGIAGLSAEMQNMPEDVRAGVFYGFMRALTDNFKEDIDKWITTQIEQRPPVEVESISEDEKKSLQEQRSTLNKQIRAIIEMAYTFGEAQGNMDDSPDPNWPMPKVRRGSVGKRGKRALTLYSWAIDGNTLDEEEDSTKGVASALGFEKAAEFTQALRDAGVNTTAPEDTFTVTINGKEVTGTRITAEDDAEDDETEPNGDSEE